MNRPRERSRYDPGADRFGADLGPLLAVLETTRLATVLTDARSPDRRITFANDSFLAMTGYERDEILGRGFGVLLEEDADGATAAAIAAGFSGSAGAVAEALYHRKQGAPFWAAIFITPVRDEAGEVTQHSTAFVDLSAHKEEESRLKMLIDELNHRVKNTLSTVRSIVAQGLRVSDNLEQVKGAIESRLFALSRSHDLLARENWRSTGLLDLMREALKPFDGGLDSARRFSVSGDNIRLKPNTALAIGIALHELATNAIKYGALSNPTGSVRISWAVEPSLQGDRLRLSWEEQGGPPVAVPTRRGFGSRVIERGLTHELMAEARLDFRPTGLVCTIDMPAPPGAGTRA